MKEIDVTGTTTGGMPQRGKAVPELTWPIDIQ